MNYVGLVYAFAATLFFLVFRFQRAQARSWVVDTALSAGMAIAWPFMIVLGVCIVLYMKINKRPLRDLE